MKRLSVLTLGLVLALICAVTLTGCAKKVKAVKPTGTNVVAESQETISNWTMARRFQAEGRYELAKQHYSLALAAARTQSALNQLQRELYTVDMQIRTMR